MKRRQFTQLMATSALWPVLPAKAADDKPHQLSSVGCGRATGYAEANKIITIGNRTHVAWLDSPAEGFRVRVATLNRNSGKWSRPITVGNAHDNHGGPALTCDSEGYLHIVYYTHHHPFRYRRSKLPNDASEWDDEQFIGDKLTYPTLVCAKDNSLYLTARRSDKNPWWVELWEKPPGRAWLKVGPIMVSRHKGYAHFQESLSWGPDHKTLHLCCRFHELSDKSSYGRLQTVAYMKSTDFGRTWQRSDDSLIKTPATVEKIEVIARGGEDFKQTLRAGCLAVSPKGMPHLLFSIKANNRNHTYLTVLDSNGKWQRTDLHDHLPKTWQDYNLTMAGGLAFDAKGILHGVAQLQTGQRGPKIWGDPTNEIVKFVQRGNRFEFRALSEFDPKVSHWLPSIERPTGHNLVPTLPGVLFTGGPAGVGNKDLISNNVYWNR